jgi:hypothetical protein
MALTEIEFDLTAQQFALMGYPPLRQGQILTLVLETSVLLPDPGAESWFAVQPEPTPMQLVQVGRGQYAFSAPIERAEVSNEDGVESAALLVRCGDVPLRVMCAPDPDGRLPYGTWETRTVTGYSRLFGIVEEDFTVGIGETVDVTVWQFRRLVLKPGDPVFGEWRETDTLSPTPYEYDRVVVTARIHRRGIG